MQAKRHRYQKTRQQHGARYDTNSIPEPVACAPADQLIDIWGRTTPVPSSASRIEYARGIDLESFDRAVDVEVSRIRRKLATEGGNDLIRTVRNEGYMFTAAVFKQRASTPTRD